MAKKKAKVRRTGRRKEQCAWVPGIEKFGVITQVDADGTTHIQCDDGYRWHGPSEAIVTDADIAAAKQETETVKIVEPTTTEVAVNG